MPRTDTTSLYQAYPHLRKIDDLWGTQAARDLIQSLLHDSRDGARQGFPLEHASTLFSLFMEHDEVFPQFENSGVFGHTNEDQEAQNPWENDGPTRKGEV